MIEVHQLPALKDNYAFVIREPLSGATAAVDTPEAAVIRRFLDERGWKLDAILSTHHHPDHIGGNLELRHHYGSRIYGSARDAARIPGIEIRLTAGEEFFLGKERVQVIGCDGHTLGHIAFWFPESKAVFVGDTIFSLGCGGLFEGTPEQMWQSLARLRELPGDTRVYCAHEYTLANAAFAVTVEPGNASLHERIRECDRLRANAHPTVPSTMDSERACNPFLRPESLEIQRMVRMVGRKPAEVFGAVREAKDAFDSRA